MRWVGIALLIWSLAYCALVYFSFASSSPETLANLVSQGTIKQEYADYILAIPDWVRIVTVMLAAVRFVGSAGLILDKDWAVQAFALALILTGIIMYRGFVIARVAEVIRPSQVVVEIAFIGISVFAVWFSSRRRKALTS